MSFSTVHGTGDVFVVRLDLLDKKTAIRYVLIRILEPCELQ